MIETERTEPPSLLRPLLWTFAILCVSYLPLFLGQIIFFRDVAHWGVPARAFLRTSLASGELPTWNPYQGLGFPVFADPLYGVFYLPNWLYLLVGPGWVASMFNWQCFAHLLWGTAGVCWLARRLGASSKAVVIAGLAWGLSGYTTSQWTSGILLLADAWIPWTAAGHVVLLDRWRSGGAAWRRGLLLATLPTLLAVLLGEVFLAFIGAGFGIVFAQTLHYVERSAHPRPTRTGRVRALVAAGLAVLLAFAAGAVVILPARALLGATDRAGALPRTTAESCSLHPLRLFEFTAPQAMGDAYADYPAAKVVGEPGLDGLPLSYSVYMGAGVLALALAAFGRRRPLASALAALLVPALLLALGRHTPVHGLFRWVVYPLAYMRYPEKYTVLVVLCLALLAALGADRVTSASAKPWRRNALYAATLLGLGAIALVALPPPWARFAVHGLAVALIVAVTVLALQRLALRNAALATALLVGVVALDLAAAAWPLQAFTPRRIANEIPPAADAVLRTTGNAIAPPRIYRSNLVTDATNKWLPPASAPYIEPRLMATLITNTTNLWGIGTLPGYDAAVPRVVEDVWHAGMAVGQSALRLLAADFAVLPVENPRAAGDDRPGLAPVFDPLPGARLYRVPGRLPRVYWARRAERISDAQALARLYEPDVVAGNIVWLPQGGATPSIGSVPGRGGECQLLTYRQSRLVADCIGQEPGIVVFVEQHAPGWRATIDGTQAPLVQANLLMRGLRVQPGRHRIELHYEVPWLHAGVLVTSTSFVLLIGIARWPRRKNAANPISAEPGTWAARDLRGRSDVQHDCPLRTRPARTAQRRNVTYQHLAAKP